MVGLTYDNACACQTPTPERRHTGLSIWAASQIEAALRRAGSDKVLIARDQWTVRAYLEDYGSTVEVATFEVSIDSHGRDLNAGTMSCEVLRYRIHGDSLDADLQADAPRVLVDLASEFGHEAVEFLRQQAEWPLQEWTPA